MAVLAEVGADALTTVVDLLRVVLMVEMLVEQIVIVVLHVQVVMVELILVVVEVVATVALEQLAVLVYSLLGISFNRR
jgi:nicotinamide riboside transporter PnuC